MNTLYLDNLLAYYKKVRCGYYKATMKKVQYCSEEKSTIMSYVNYIKAYDKLNGNHTCSDIMDLIQNGRTDVDENGVGRQMSVLDKARSLFDDVVRDKGLQGNTIGNYKTAYMDFCRVVVGRYNADVWFDNPQTDSIYRLIAENAVFASPEVVDCLTKGTLLFDGKKKEMDRYACWDRRFIRDNSKRKGTETKDEKNRTCMADDNTQANHAIKYAVRESCPDVKIGSISCFKNYEACHIVSKVNNVTYFTSIPNLVLLHRALAGLTDHIKDIQNLLDYHAWNLYHKSIPDWKTPVLSPKLERVYKELEWRVNW